MASHQDRTKSWVERTNLCRRGVEVSPSCHGSGRCLQGSLGLEFELSPSLHVHHLLVNPFFFDFGDCSDCRRASASVRWTLAADELFASLFVVKTQAGPAAGSLNHVFPEKWNLLTRCGGKLLALSAALQPLACCAHCTQQTNPVSPFFWPGLGVHP